MVHNFIDMLGKRIGFVTVIERAYIENARKDARWYCLCDCGNTKIFTGANLRSGSIKSCGISGCLYAKNRKYLDTRSRALNYFFIRYQNGARNRSLEWSLTFTEFCAIIQNCCYYCANKTIYKLNVGAKDTQITYIKLLACGIDRIDSTLGYTLINCIPCCEQCNRAKGILTQNDFITMCKIIAERH